MPYSWEFEIPPHLRGMDRDGNRCVIRNGNFKVIAWAVDAETAQRVVDALNKALQP